MTSSTATLPNGHSTANGNTANGISPASDVVETPYLIVGAGPAGASLACFLAEYGLTGLVVVKAPGVSPQPRAHITNAAALECMRDIDLERDCIRNATPGNCMQHTRWCRSMAGEEWARIYSWGNQPHRKGEYEAMSPCQHVDLPQTLFEPIIRDRAVNKGWKFRYDSAFIKYERDDRWGPITSTICDVITGREWKVRSKYVFGCDGAQSQVIRQLGLPLKKDPSQGLAINVLIKADLSKHLEHRPGNLHWIFTPDIDYPLWGWTCIMRMVKAWDEWIMIIIPHPTFKDFSVRPTHEEYLQRAREWIGDDSIDVKIMDVGKWYINEVVAERYSDGNIFCFGDSTHRHPPFNGLGSNTCVQDAYNLAWKIAYVDRNLASPTLLESFSLERQPVGQGVIRRANQGLRDHAPVYDALGVLPLDIESRMAAFNELSAPTPGGAKRRDALRRAVAYTEHEFGGIGQEMNYWYQSQAVYTKDEPGPREEMTGDKVLTYQITTYPGARLPHAWLNTRLPGPRVSTHDLAGKGAFALFTGATGADTWRHAAAHAAAELGVTVNAFSIGWMQDWEDQYGEWARRSEVQEDGCVLVRPDRVVGWRSMTARADAKEHLSKVLGCILGRQCS